MGRTSLASLQARLDRRMSPVIVTWNVVEYRKAAEQHVSRDDVVLEVGCCGGMTTAIIGKRCNYVLGIDQTKAEIENARKRFGEIGAVEFEEMDAFDMAGVMRLQQKLNKKFNKVFIDINGSRDIGTVYDCLDKYQKVLHPDLIVLKSIKVRTLLHQCIPWTSAAEGQPSCGDEEDASHDLAAAQDEETSHDNGCCDHVLSQSEGAETAAFGVPKEEGACKTEVVDGREKREGGGTPGST